MMTDRKLLEYAAKAAGYSLHANLMEQRAIASPDAIALALSDPGNTWWNPLDDDGDALRLACALKLNTAHGVHSVGVGDEDEIEEAAAVLDEAQRTSALRRAIVLAAAAMGAAAGKA